MLALIRGATLVVSGIAAADQASAQHVAPKVRLGPRLDAGAWYNELSSRYYDLSSVTIETDSDDALNDGGDVQGTVAPGLYFLIPIGRSIELGALASGMLGGGEFLTYGASLELSGRWVFDDAFFAGAVAQMAAWQVEYDDLGGITCDSDGDCLGDFTVQADINPFVHVGATGGVFLDPERRFELGASFRAGVPTDHGELSIYATAHASYAFPVTWPAAATRAAEAKPVTKAQQPGDGAAPEPRSARELAGTVSAIAGFAVPIDGLEYSAGFGIRGGIHVSRFYFGAIAAAHLGDSKTVAYGAVPNLSIDGGTQHYDSLPLMFAADVGYGIPLWLGALETTLTPYLSGGVLALSMSTHGVYGSDDVMELFPLIGGGFSYAIWLTESLSVGLHYRMYPVGDAEFQFGSLSTGTNQHGFSSSIFHAAFYSEVGFRF